MGARMSGGKMTPGPWAIGLDSDNERTQVITGDGQHLCYVEQDPHEANARAIAALPELVEAARAITKWDDDREEGEPTDCEMLDDLTQRIEAMRRILARIEGGD